MDKRYQFQPFYVRWYRWLKWKPLYWIKALLHIGTWAWQGGSLPSWWCGSRRNYAEDLLAISMSEADFRMGYYWYDDELDDWDKRHGVGR